LAAWGLYLPASHKEQAPEASELHFPEGQLVQGADAPVVLEAVPATQEVHATAAAAEAYFPAVQSEQAPKDKSPLYFPIVQSSHPDDEPAALDFPPGHAVQSLSWEAP